MFALFDGRHSRRRSLGLGSIHVHLLLGALSGPLVTKLNLALPLRIKETVPEDKKGLREVGFDTPTLMMNIVIGSIVGGEMLQRVPGKGVSAVVIDSLDGRAGEKPHRLAVGHTGNQEANACTRSIQKEALNGVVV
jgi:hypothetical protein